MSIARRHRTLHEAHEDEMYRRWTVAEDLTVGYMVSAAARERGVRGADLYIAGQGRAPASCASNELRELWERGLVPRPISFAAFEALHRAPVEETPDVEPEMFLDLGMVARRIRVTYRSVRAYRSRPGAMPAPDIMLGQSPGWRESTIDAWVLARRGRKGLLG